MKRLIVLLTLLIAVVGCSGPKDPPISSIKPIDSAEVAVAQMNLKTDAELAACSIQVKAENDLLVLSGQVPNQAAKERAEALAKKARGITKVANHLEVVPVPGQDSSGLQDFH